MESTKELDGESSLPDGQSYFGQVLLNAKDIIAEVFEWFVYLVEVGLYMIVTLW